MKRSQSAGALLLCLFAGMLSLTSCSKLPPEAKSAQEMRPVAAGASGSLPKLATPARAVMERIGEVWSPLVHQPVPVPAGAPVTFAGWAVDEARQTLAGGVDVLLDGTPYAAEYGIERADVASYTKAPAYQNSGFQLTLPADKLKKGRHQVVVHVLTQDRKAFYESAPLAIEVK